MIQRENINDVSLKNHCEKILHHATVKRNVDLVVIGQLLDQENLLRTHDPYILLNASVCTVTQARNVYK
jgi:hypothetical protein